MKVAVISEFYPRRSDPVLGVWAHRQALAAQAAGAQVRVLVLHRVVPPRASLAEGPRHALNAFRGLAGQPMHEVRDGLEVTYVPFLSPPRSKSYPSWGSWAAPALSLALRSLRRPFAFDLIHAHNAIPAADATRRARIGVPLIISVHGGDVLYTAVRYKDGRKRVGDALTAGRLVLANSNGIADLSSELGARDVRVVHLGSDLPSPLSPSQRSHTPVLVTAAHLIARKRHADVLRALAVLSERHPTLRYRIIGDGPERVALEGLAARLCISERVEFCGQLDPARTLEHIRACTLFVMPSTEEAFGVAYVEAMAAGIPAIGCRGEPGPEEIAAAGDGLVLVPPGDIERLTQRIQELLEDTDRLRETARRARETVIANFTWERCGLQTVAAYEDALR